MGKTKDKKHKISELQEAIVKQ